MGINASSTISVNEEDGDVTFHVPSAQLSTFGATYSFKAPLPLPEFLHKQEEEKEDEEQEQSAGAKGLDTEDEPVQVTINAGVMGNIAHPKQKATVSYEDDTTEEIQVGDQQDRGLRSTNSLCSRSRSRLCWCPKISH